MSSRPVLWEASAARKSASALARFIALAGERRGLPFANYADTWAWSVADPRAFWSLAWDFVEMKARFKGEQVVDDPKRMPGAHWFPDARLNFAENLLRHEGEREALVAWDERGPRRRLTRNELRREVARAQAALQAAGVVPGDRVVGFLPNIPETVIAMLAATSLGATWSSCSPDFGTRGVLDRFGQIAPKVLFAADGQIHGGKRHDSLARLETILAELPTVEQVVVVPHVEEQPDLSKVSRAMSWEQFLGKGTAPTLHFPQFPFEHPLYVMYSSGTTGLPKCMVQGAGGVLLNQLKEHVLHVDLRQEDAIFYFTTCGWMMWNWLVAALAVGSRIVLWDGSPFHPDPGALWRMAETERLAVFGTSAKYLSALEKEGHEPARHHDLSALRTVLSTGSPLSPESFRYVYSAVKQDVHLASISGGTDLNGCFVLGNPLLPVREGEIQCRGLGMDVRALDSSGAELVGEMGELACMTAFPSSPTHFWNDPDGSRYRRAYFERFEGAWLHGDFIEITREGGAVITGRSDATLNPGGVRIGTADLYRVVEGIAEVKDSLAVAQDWEGDVRIVLFVRMSPGAELTDELRARIRGALKEQASPRHVPAKIVAVGDIPYTISGKKVELAVRNIIHGRPVENRDALANPASLDLYADLPELRS